MYKFKLENEGFEIDIASTGPSGLELIKSKLPHLVLLDLRLPHMSGDEILERMRASDWGKNISVLIMANVARWHAPKRLHTLEFERYIIKAEHTPRQIHEIIQETLGLREFNS